MIRPSEIRPCPAIFLIGLPRGIHLNSSAMSILPPTLPRLEISSTLPLPQAPILRHLFLLLLGVTFAAFLRWATRPDPLRHVPGPWLARWTTLLLAYHARTGKRHLYVDALHKVRLLLLLLLLPVRHSNTPRHMGPLSASPLHMYPAQRLPPCPPYTLTAPPPSQNPHSTAHFMCQASPISSAPKTALATHANGERSHMRSVRSL